MQISASMFTDPTMRTGLQQYYENRKAAAVEAWKARENEELPTEVKYKDADGKLQTATMIPISAEKLEKSFVGFDKWLEFQVDSFDNAGFGPNRLAMAQQRLDDLKAQGPESSSNVRATFSSQGTLLAYINADGSLVTSSLCATPSLESKIQALVKNADARGLSGQSRVDYLTRELNSTLSQKYDVTMTTYDDTTTPTKREFATTWYKHFNIEQTYQDALADAQASYDEANAGYRQWQSNMNEIQSFLLSLQETA